MISLFDLVRMYKDVMVSIGECGHKGRPRAIPVEGLPHTIPPDQLQIMLGADPAFCSWNISSSAVSDLTTGWPFLFAKPLLRAR
jgi:hypothetical protein